MMSTPLFKRLAVLLMTTNEENIKQEGHDGPLSLTRVNGHVFCHIKIS